MSKVIICDDLPADYVRHLYGDRLEKDAQVFSRSDALKETPQKPRLRHRAYRSNTGFKLGDVARIT